MPASRSADRYSWAADLDMPMACPAARGRGAPRGTSTRISTGSDLRGHAGDHRERSPGRSCGERAALVQLPDVGQPLPESAPGLLPGSGRSGGGDLAGALQDRAGRGVTLADDLAPADRGACRCRTSGRAGSASSAAPSRCRSSPAWPPEYSEMSGSSFSAPTAWRASESRASMPYTTVDRLTRTPEPPVQVDGGPLPGQDQDDGGLALLGRPGTPGAWWRPRCCRSRRSRRS